jgi:hypothetical protein
MSLTYKFNDASNPGPDAGRKEPEGDKNIERFETSGGIRNVCFVDVQGNEEFFNYAYLVKGKYMPEENTIALTFSSDIVTLKGRNLAGLFNELGAQVPKKIITLDKRYEGTKGDTETYVTEIAVQKFQ